MKSTRSYWQSNDRSIDRSLSELFERLAEGMNPLETLTKLRGRVEFKEKEKILSELHALRTEHRL